jgi:hypothetical protein
MTIACPVILMITIYYIQFAPAFGLIGGIVDILVVSGLSSIPNTSAGFK